jgi:hypothetical protein
MFESLKAVCLGMCQQGSFQMTMTRKRQLLRWRLCARSWTSCEASESATQPRSCWKSTATTWCAILAAHISRNAPSEAHVAAAVDMQSHAVFYRLLCEAVHERQRNLITVFDLLMPRSFYGFSCPSVPSLHVCTRPF